MPRTFGGRLTVAFVAVIALTLSLVSVLVLNRLDAYFVQQQEADLRERSTTVSGYIKVQAEAAAGRSPVVGADGLLDEDVVDVLNDPVLPGIHHRPPRPGGRHRALRAQRHDRRPDDVHPRAEWHVPDEPAGSPASRPVA